MAGHWQLWEQCRWRSGEWAVMTRTLKSVAACEKEQKGVYVCRCTAGLGTFQSWLRSALSPLTAAVSEITPETLSFLYVNCIYCALPPFLSDLD